MLASDCVDAARLALFDPAPGAGWSDAELLTYLNEAIRDSVAAKPDIYPVSGDIPLAAGVVQTLPVGAMVFVVVAWVIGAFDGGFVAALIARNGHPRAAAVVPALMVMAGVVGMIVKMPGHPLWMAVVGLLLPIPAALAGAWLAARAAAGPDRQTR